MRMWMVDPKKMCRRHLLGEHVETHMFLGTLKRGIRIGGYIDKNLFEPLSLSTRHDELAKEMVRRGYNHRSEIDCDEVSHLLQYLNDIELHTRVDKERSFDDLISRCPDCAER